MPINVNRILLSTQAKVLNLNANNSQGATNKKENVNVMITRNRSFEMNVSHGPFKYTREVMNNALAGVGRPMKESF